MSRKWPGKKWIPFTSGGSMLVNLGTDTKHQAIKNLMEDARHMPYETWKDFIERGYTIVNMKEGGE